MKLNYFSVNEFVGLSWIGDRLDTKRAVVLAFEPAGLYRVQVCLPLEQYGPREELITTGTLLNKLSPLEQLAFQA